MMPPICMVLAYIHDCFFRRLMSMSRVIRVKDKGWMICFRTKVRAWFSINDYIIIANIILFCPKEMNNIYGMFRTRCSLFQRALHHKTKITAELMYVHQFYL